MTDNIINFLNFEDPGLEPVSCCVEKGKRVVTLQKKPEPHYCPICGYRMHSKGIRTRTVNHPILQDGLPLILKVKQRRWLCTNPACRNLIADEFSFVQKYQHNSNLTTLLILNAFRNPNLSAVQIARQFNVSDTYALGIFSKYVHQHRRQLTAAICVDEVHVDVSHVCNYAMVIQDFITGEPIDMIPSRRQEFTEPYFAAIPQGERNVVRYLISDMYKPYIGFVDKYFPNAVSVVDSFHVVKFINNKLNQYMNALARKIRAADEELHSEKEARLHRSLKFVPSREYYLIRKFRWVILSNPENLNYSKEPWFNYKLNQYVDLHELEYYIFQIDPDLKVLRNLKDKYIRFNNTYGNNPKKARAALNNLIREYRYSGYPMFREIADTLDVHFESIINSFIIMERYCADGAHLSRLSNGPIESLNRIAKDLKRNGRGYRNFEHLRDRFLFATRKNAQILAVPRPKSEYAPTTGRKRGPYKKSR